MVVEALIVTAVASAMLGWNVHVIYRSGVCCPTQGGSNAETSAPPRSAQRSTLRRRRRPSRRWLKEQQEAEAAAAAASAGATGAKMEPITENLLAPAADAAVVGTVNGEGVQGA